MNKQRRNIRVTITLFIVMFSLLTVYLGYSVLMYGDRWFANSYNPMIVSEQSNVVIGDLLDRNKTVLATNDSDGNRAYASDKDTRISTSLVVGESSGITTAGAEAFFANYLLGFNDNVVERLYQEITGVQREGSDVVLTIDAELTKYAYNALGDYRGAVVVMDYETGEILVSASKPGFDQNNIEQYLGVENDVESPLVNRVTMGRYIPGSVFKIVTTLALLESDPDATSLTFDCEGEYEIGNDVITDYGGARHGEITLAEAFEKSCNNTYAKIGTELGAGKLNATAEEFGFNKNFLFDDMVLYSSSYEIPDEAGDLAWSAVGQHKDLVTPLHMCMIVNAIANDGVMMEPKLVKNLVNVRGYDYQEMTPNEYSTPLSEKNASIITDMMLSVVESGTGTKASVSGWDIAGKTGTAEVSQDGSTKPNAWFVGFCNEDDHPLSIVVVMEDAGSGGTYAAPVAQKVLTKAKELGY